MNAFQGIYTGKCLQSALNDKSMNMWDFVNNRLHARLQRLIGSFVMPGAIKIGQVDAITASAIILATP